MQISQQTEITIPQIPVNFDISSLNLKLNKKDSLIYLTEKKSYTPIASCVCEHIITTSTLTASQKLYYILADCLALVNLNLGGKREVKLSSNKWAKRLGCSKSTILNLQESLEEEGYFDVQRGKNEFKQDNRNIITPTMPDDIFNTLEAAESRIEETLPFDTSKDSKEYKRSYLDRAKLFIPINYQLLLFVFSSSKLNSAQKITWLDFYIRSYKLYIANLNSDKNDIDEINKYNFYFVSSYQELTSTYSCSSKYLSKNINILEKQGFLTRKHFYTMKNKTKQVEQSKQDRQDHSLWFFSLSLPDELILQLKTVKDRRIAKYDANSANKKKSTISNNNDTDVLNKIIENEENQDEEEQNIEYKYDEEEYIEVVMNELDNDNYFADNSDNYNSYYNYHSVASNSSISYSNAPHSSFDISNTSFSAASSLDNNYSITSFNFNDNSKVDLSRNLNESTNFVNSNFDNSLNPTKPLNYKDFSKDVSDDVASYDNSLNPTKPLNYKDFSKDVSDDVASYDPDFACSRPYYNISLLTNSFNSTLQGKQKVIFNKFLNDFDFNNNQIKRKEGGKRKFSICSALIQNIIKKLPKNKIDKARKFAYSLISKKLAKGYAATINKHELAKQFIYHIGTWKPTKSGALSQEQQIDIALSTAWKAVTNGNWKIPYDWAKAWILDFEYTAYKQKYQDSGVISEDLRTLEKDVCKLFGYTFFDLEKRIIESSPYIPNNFTNFDDDLVEQSNNMEVTLKQTNSSELLKNFDLYRKLERQGYFKTEFADDGMSFKTNPVNNEQYSLVLNNIKVDDEDVYMTLKLTKGILIMEDIKQSCLQDHKENGLLAY